MQKRFTHDIKRSAESSNWSFSLIISVHSDNKIEKEIDCGIERLLHDLPGIMRRYQSEGKDFFISPDRKLIHERRRRRDLSEENEMKKKTAHETRQKICYKALWLTYIVLFYSLPSLFFHKQLLQLIRCIHESTTAMIVSHFGACFLTLEYEFLFARESFSFSEFVIESFHSPLVEIFPETEKIWAKNVRIADGMPKLSFYDEYRWRLDLTQRSRHLFPSSIYF